MRSVLGLALLIAVTVSLGAGLTTRSSALFTDASPVDSNTITSDTLNAPTSVSATTGSSISLSWTATSDTYASGHRIFRSTTSGSGYSQIAQVTPRTTTTYVDSPSPGTYYYVVRSYFQNWESVDSNQAATGVWNTGFLNCTSNAAVTTSSGDNNGFETTPGNACTDGGVSGTDANSGTGTGTSCTAPGKDRHIFYDYGASIPASSTINGIEVRLDARVSSTTSNPFMCVELSWNNGASWTTAKTTATLGTSEATFTLGTPSDTWGRTWSAGDLSNGNFRVRVTDVASSTARTFSLDWVAVKISFTPP